MRGGDTRAHPTSIDQQKNLLNLTVIANRQVSCSLPISNTQLKGVIFGAPISDSEEELKAALAEQEVTDVKRLPIKGRQDIRSETILLTFEKKLPDRVNIASMIFKVRPSIPNPFRCKKCFRLGHIASRCSEQQCCSKCAKPHLAETICTPRCVNCNSPSHISESDTCPAYLEMKAIIKLSINLGLSIAEARIHHNRLFSQVAQGPVRSTPTATPQPVIPSEISLQIRKIQDELKELRENTIADINNSMVTLSQDLDDTKARLNSIDARFDKLEKTQELHSTAAAATAASQSMRFDKLDAVLSKLVTAILGPSTVTPQILHSDVNLQSGAPIDSPPQSRSSFSLMSPIIEDSHPNRDESNFMDEY